MTRRSDGPTCWTARISSNSASGSNVPSMPSRCPIRSSIRAFVAADVVPLTVVVGPSSPPSVPASGCRPSVGWGRGPRRRVLVQVLLLGAEVVATVPRCRNKTDLRGRGRGCGRGPRSVPRPSSSLHSRLCPVHFSARFRSVSGAGPAQFTAQRWQTGAVVSGGAGVEPRVGGRTRGVRSVVGDRGGPPAKPKRTRSLPLPVPGRSGKIRATREGVATHCEQTAGPRAASHGDYGSVTQ